MQMVLIISAPVFTNGALGKVSHGVNKRCNGLVIKRAEDGIGYTPGYKENDERKPYHKYIAGYKAYRKEYSAVYNGIRNNGLPIGMNIWQQHERLYLVMVYPWCSISQHHTKGRCRKYKQGDKKRS